MHTSDTPLPIRACWLFWIAVPGSGQAELVAQLGLAGVEDSRWARGAELIDEVAHAGEERFSTVVITPPLDGWTLVVGAWCGLPHLTRTTAVTDLCQQLSLQ